MFCVGNSDLINVPPGRAELDVDLCTVQLQLFAS